MAYGSVLTDTVQSSTAATAPVFKDGNGTQIGTLCRAWVRYAGATGVVAASFNVSSVTYNTTGYWTINMTNALADTNYCVQAFHGGTAGVWDMRGADEAFTRTTTAFAVTCVNDGSVGTGSNPLIVQVAVFR